MAGELICGIKKKKKSCHISLVVSLERYSKWISTPLISMPLPDRPWKGIALDLCEYDKQNYLIMSDYYSRLIEIQHIPTTTQATMKLKGTFTRYDSADESLRTIGPNSSSSEFQEMAKQLDFKHITSSLHNPQGNGRAERAVQTAKRIQKTGWLLSCVYRSIPQQQKDTRNLGEKLAT